MKTQVLVLSILKAVCLVTLFTSCLVYLSSPWLSVCPGNISLWQKRNRSLKKKQVNIIEPINMSSVNELSSRTVVKCGKK